jgi:hypothetical protein
VYLIFKEKLTKVKIACLAFGMLGVIIITRPDNQDFNGGSALVLLAVLLWSLASILLKKIGSKANNASQLFFTYFFRNHYFITLRNKQLAASASNSISTYVCHKYTNYLSVYRPVSGL